MTRVITQWRHRLGRWPVAEGLVLLVAALARFWRLDGHSFWFDEVVSLRWAFAAPEWTWDKTFALLEEKHPPGYYLTLHLWKEGLAWFGLEQSDAGLRSLGSLLGVLTVLGILLLARRISGRRVSLLAGLFVALSPVLVWYSQEARMFQPAATALVWAALFLVGMRDWGLGTGDWGLGTGKRGFQPVPPQYPISNTQYPNIPISHLLCWLGLIGSLLYALYSYLFAAFFLPGLGLSLILLCWRGGRMDWRGFAQGVAALGIATAFWLPLARNAWLVNQAESPAGQFFGNAGPILWQQVRIFTLWRVDWPGWLVSAGVALFGFLLLAGLLRGAGTRAGRMGLLILLWGGFPLLIALALQVTNARMFGEDRYHLFVAPFLLWGMALGGDWLIRRLGRWGWGGVLAGLILLTAALPQVWAPQHLREDWRGSAAFLAGYADQSPGMLNAGVGHVDYMVMALDWYLRQSYPADAFPTYGLFGGTLTRDQVDDVIAPPLQGIETFLGADTLFLAESHLEGVDEEGLVAGWLDQRYPRLLESFPPGIRLTAYPLRTIYPALPPLPPTAQRTEAELLPGGVLAACQVVTPRTAAQRSEAHPFGGQILVRLWWQTADALTPPLARSVQIVDGQGVWGQPSPAQATFTPHQPWLPGDFLRDELTLFLNPATPPGRYPVTVSGEMGSVPCGDAQIHE